MKKILSMLLVMLLAVSVFAGCGEKKVETRKIESSDIEKLDKALEIFENADSFGVLLQTQTRVSTVGGTADTNIDAECDVDLKSGKTYMVMEIESSGESAKTESYIFEKGGVVDVFLCGEGQWMKQTGIPKEKAGELGLIIGEDKLMASYVEALKKDSVVSEEKVNGVDCYVFRGKTDAYDSISENNSGLSNLLKQLAESGVSASVIEKIVTSSGSMGLFFAIDKETCHPVKVEIDMTEVAQNIYSGISKEVDGMEDLNIKVERNLAVSNYSNFNTIPEIILPDEARNAPESALY